MEPRFSEPCLTADGKVERGDAYTMIDQAAKGSYFFRLVISPDPKREDSDKNLCTQRADRKDYAEPRRPFPAPPTMGSSHTCRPCRTPACTCFRHRARAAQVQDFQRMRSAATEEALEQRTAA